MWSSGVKSLRLLANVLCPFFVVLHLPCSLNSLNWTVRSCGVFHLRPPFFVPLLIWTQNKQFAWCCGVQNGQFQVTCVVMPDLCAALFYLFNFSDSIAQHCSISLTSPTSSALDNPCLVVILFCAPQNLKSFFWTTSRLDLLHCHSASPRTDHHLFEHWRWQFLPTLNTSLRRQHVVCQNNQ